MSVPNTLTRVQYTLSSATQTVTIPFFFIDQAHVKVVRLRSGVYTTLAIATDYTTTGQTVELGGSVIFTGLNTAVADVITILRNVPINQLTDYAYNGRFPAETTERALDRLTMVCQMLSETLGRSIQFQPGEVLSGETVLSSRLGKILSFSPTGAVAYTDPAVLIA